MTQRLVSTVVRLGDVTYYMHSSPLVSTVHAFSSRNKVLMYLKIEDDLSSIGSGQVAEPCTVLTVGRSIPTLSGIEEMLEGFLSVDDVWSRDFIHSLVVQASFPSSAAALTDTLRRTFLKIPGVSSVSVVHVAEDSTTLPQGPYFLDHGHLHHAYRLYPDTAGAFIVATVPADDDNTYV